MARWAAAGGAEPARVRGSRCGSPRCARPADPAVLAISLHACLRHGLSPCRSTRGSRTPSRPSASRPATTPSRSHLSPPLAQLTATLAGGEEPGGGLSSMPGAAGRAPWMDPAAQPRRPIAGSGDDAHTPAVLLYTSGSTGPGTPVLLSRGNLLWNASVQRRRSVSLPMNGALRHAHCACGRPHGAHPLGGRGPRRQSCARGLMQPSRPPSSWTARPPSRRWCRRCSAACSIWGSQLRRICAWCCWAAARSLRRSWSAPLPRACRWRPPTE